MKDKASKIHLFNRAMIRLRMLEDELGVTFYSNQYTPAILVSQADDLDYLGTRFNRDYIEISDHIAYDLRNR